MDLFRNQQLLGYNKDGRKNLLALGVSWTLAGCPAEAPRDTSERGYLWAGVEGKGNAVARGSRTSLAARRPRSDLAAVQL